MRISVRFALMLSAVGLLASGLQAWTSINSADDELRAAREHDLTVLGRSLQVSVEIALRDKALADLQELMTRVQELAPEVDIALLDTRRQLRSGAGPHGVSPQTLQQALAAVPSLERASFRWLEGDEPTLVAMLPLRDTNRESLGTLVIVQEVPNLDDALAEQRKAALWSVVLVVLGIAAVSLVLGRLSITVPLEQLVGAMRRARLRALDERIHSQRRNEIGELAREYDAMMDRLVATQSALERQQERRYELEQQLARLDKLATVGQLAATLAHEIGSPLQVLVGRANVLAEREHPPEKVRHHAARIAEQGKRITDIVEKLLGYARRRPPTRQIVDIRDAAETVVDLLEHEASRREISLQLRRSSQSTQTFADNDQLQQAIFNLARNALDASAAGGTVVVEVRPTHDERGAWVEVAVRDRGVGIATGDLGHLTEPFFTTRAHEGGTGLGLSVVKAIALSHQGELVFHSADGETVAILRLPRHERRNETT